MATRESVNECLEKCKTTLTFAEDQYKAASLQEHFNDDEYIQAKLQLEQVDIDLEKIMNSASDLQRDTLERMQIQVHELQNKMTTLRH